MEFGFDVGDNHIQEILSSNDFKVAIEMASKEYKITPNSQENIVRLINLALIIYFQIEDDFTYSLSIPQESLILNQNN